MLQTIYMAGEKSPCNFNQLGERPLNRQEDMAKDGVEDGVEDGALD